MTPFFRTLGIVMLSCLSLPCLGEEPPPGPFLPMPENLVPFDSPEGRKLFLESGSKESFWPLAQFYSTQPDSGSCGVASAVMVLNALPIQRPSSPPHGNQALFTPENFFSPAVNSIKKASDVSNSGMTLDQLTQSLATFSVTVERHYATPESLAAFRSEVKEMLGRQNRFILVNYLRKTIQQQSGGHISPLGAYHEGKDMLLVMDVANYKYPWTWVPVEGLYKAMSATDDSSGQARGWVVVGSK